MEPARVVVVEDTVIGVEAAVSAEMTVYGYAEHGNSERLRAAVATDTFASMDELPALIGSGGTLTTPRLPSVSPPSRERYPGA